MSNKADATTMKQATKRELKPKLRFPEFRDDEEWEEEHLKKLADVIMGSSPSSEAYNTDGIGLPFMQGNADIKDGLSAPRLFTSQVTKECKVGDILLSVRAPVGSVAKSIHQACIGRGLSSIRALSPNKQEYLYQFLVFFESQWHKISQGGTFDAINSDDLKDLQVTVPHDSAEQQKIADCLSSIDELITAQTQKLDTLKTHKKGLMQQLFPAEGETLPKLRFPEFRDAGEWEEKQLDAVASFAKAKIPLSGLTLQNYVSTENILPDFSGITHATRLPPTGAATAFRVGDILISNIRPYLKKIWHSEFDGGASNDVLIIRAKKTINDKYLSFVLKNDFFINYVMTGAKGVKMPRGDISLIERFGVPLPSCSKEQQKIADCLSSIDELITAQTQKLATLKTHKKGLMQALFPTAYEVST